MKAIDADALEREGWYINRIIQTSKTAMEYQTKKPTEFPAIETERKTGKWIDKGWNGDWQYQVDGRGRSWHEWQCSECNHITKGAKWHFCPNCGVDMRGEQDG